MLNQLLKLNNVRIQNERYAKAYTLCIYVIARAYKIMLLIQSIDEDYFIDFKDDLAILGELIGNNPLLMKTAINNGLDVNWMLDGAIPLDIAVFHKDLRQKGFLK